MHKPKSKAYTRNVKALMAEKSLMLSKAHALSEAGLKETAQPVWASAAAYEERIAPLLDTLWRDSEAAFHRVSAASCYREAGDFSRAINLYRAALAGPLREESRREVEQMLSDCLTELSRRPAKASSTRRFREPAIP